MANDEFVKEIADIKTDFPQWYTDVVLKTEMADYGPVKGTMVMRPYGYAVWENIQSEMDRRIKSTGAKNTYFPIFIPYSFLAKEADHVEGFAPEVAVVTYAGGEELAEKLVVRPTSETIICNMFAKWVQSYRDLPMMINQWCNVVRWEKTTRPFLRTSEFLWQEGHTLHATPEEAQEETLRMLEVYREFSENVLAIPMFVGRKSEKEKFAGADATYSIEAMMQDGKSLQSGTSHNLGQNFSKAFNIKFLDKDGTHKYCYQTSWGTSTRLMGALIMVHGDQRGLVLPPKVAPYQVVIVPIAASKNAGVMEWVNSAKVALESAGIRVYVDDRDQTPGWKFNEWEMKGVPLRIEFGPKDLENHNLTMFRRDKNEKFTAPISSDLPAQISDILAEIQQYMLEKARAFRDSHICVAKTREELVEAVNEGNFVKAMWCGERACEEKLKEDTAITTRNMPADQTPISDTCACCGKKLKEGEGHVIYFAKAY